MVSAPKEDNYSNGVLQQVSKIIKHGLISTCTCKFSLRSLLKRTAAAFSVIYAVYGHLACLYSHVLRAYCNFKSKEVILKTLFGLIAQIIRGVNEISVK